MMNTDSYTRSPLWIMVYCKDKEGRPISWTRLYPATVRNIQRVCRALDEYYGRPLEDRQEYICIEDLAKLCNIKNRNLTNLLIRMASCREVWARVDGQFRVLKRGPYVLLMQKAKYQHPSWYKMKTAIAIFPFEKRFYHYLSFDNVIGLM